jgi:hypothetical protein
MGAIDEQEAAERVVAMFAAERPNWARSARHANRRA